MKTLILPRAVIILDYGVWMNVFLLRRYSIHTWLKLITSCKRSLRFLAFPHRPFQFMTLTSCTCKNAMLLGVLGPNEEEIQRENNAKYYDWFDNFMSHFSGRLLRVRNINDSLLNSEKKIKVKTDKIFC